MNALTWNIKAIDLSKVEIFSFIYWFSPVLLCYHYQEKTRIDLKLKFPLYYDIYHSEYILSKKVHVGKEWFFYSNGDLCWSVKSTQPYLRCVIKFNRFWLISMVMLRGIIPSFHSFQSINHYPAQRTGTKWHMTTGTAAWTPQFEQRCNMWVSFSRCSTAHPVMMLLWVNCFYHSILPLQWIVCCMCPTGLFYSRDYPRGIGKKPGSSINLGV